MPDKVKRRLAAGAHGDASAIMAWSQFLARVAHQFYTADLRIIITEFGMPKEEWTADAMTFFTIAW